MRLLSEVGRNSVSAQGKGLRIMNAVLIDQNRTSDSFSVANTPIVCIQVVWSGGGAPVGSLQLQGSVDGTNFFNVGSTVAVSGNSGTVQLTDANAGYLYCRFTYAFTSGTATASAFAEAKGF